jgi:hypothetical protein
MSYPNLNLIIITNNLRFVSFNFHVSVKRLKRLVIVCIFMKLIKHIYSVKMNK